MVKLLSDRKIAFFVTSLFCSSFIGCLDDSSDEEVPMFECDNGETIKAYWVNDGRDDCGDRSDEFDPNKVYCDDTKPVFSNEQENVVADYVYRFIGQNYIGSSVSFPDGLHLTDDGSWDSSGSFDLVWDNTDPDYLYWDAENLGPVGICNFEILETEETGRCVAHANSITYVKIIYNIQHPGQQYYGYTMVNESYWQEAYTTEMSRDYTLAKSNENGQWGIFPEGNFPLAYDCTFDFQGIPDHSIDSDNDGIDDISETEVYGTDPSNNDTDGDGLNDYDELFVHYTNPLVVDTDNDGLTDFFEIERPDLYENTPFDDGLVGYWPFNENEGNLISDYSGYQNSANFKGGSSPPEWTEGRETNALKFDGNDDYVIVESSETINSTGNAATILMWLSFDYNSSSDQEIIFEKHTATDTLSVSIVGQAGGYSPSAPEAQVGTTVTWTNADTMTHTVTDKDAQFDSFDIAAGESWSLTFTEIGVFNYYCKYHPMMEGSITIVSDGGNGFILTSKIDKWLGPEQAWWDEENQTLIYEPYWYGQMTLKLYSYSDGQNQNMYCYEDLYFGEMSELERQWHHLGVTLTSVANSDSYIANIFLNGNTCVTSSNFYGNFLGNSSLVVGNVVNTESISEYIGEAKSFGGKIDEMAIWNRSLNDKEIAEIYNDVDGPNKFALSPILPDTDGDGLSDYEEINVLGSDPLNYSGDLDNDGLTDSIEFFIYNTDPNNNDTDGDGIDDIHDYECLSCNGPLSDLDGDGISDDFEFFIYHTNLSNNDTDGDGIDDYSEIYTFSSNPLSNDTDNDGLTDFFEADSYQENLLISLLRNSPCSATFYSDHYEDVTFDAGEYDGSELATYGVDNGLVTYWVSIVQATHVIVDPGCKIIVYDNGDFSGESHILEGDNNAEMDLGWDWMWDYTGFSSFKIGGLNDNLENNYASTHQMLYLPEQGNGNNKNPMLYYDSDSDGISDGEEVLVLGSYPFSFDSDSDGLSDGMEFIFYNTNASNFDSDYDGVSDFDEIVKYGTDPNQNHNPVVFFKDQLLETRNWFRIEEFYKFDGDGDYVADNWDNCKVNYNPDQRDSGLDGILGTNDDGENDGVGDRCKPKIGGRCYWVYRDGGYPYTYQRLYVSESECPTINRASWFYSPYPA